VATSEEGKKNVTVQQRNSEIGKSYLQIKAGLQFRELG
jgi:hypothetical protein